MMDLRWLMIFLLTSRVAQAASIGMAGLEINNRPIIGIVAQDSSSKPGRTWISATYVKYLEQAGARVVPIRAYQRPEYYANMIDYTNGLLLPGGDVSFVTSQFARSVKFLWIRAMELNRQGDYYPIWGTCMGFQILCNLTANKNMDKPTDSRNASWPLNFESDFASSRLFGSAPNDVIEYLQTENVTQNEHEYSILTEDFETSVLSKFYKKLSTNKDRKGVEFVSTFEARNFPIYGTQWHPEKNNMNWNPHYVINHSAHAVRISQYMADFFVSEARLNNHTFPDSNAEATQVIQNFPLTYVADGSFLEIYYID